MKMHKSIFRLAILSVIITIGSQLLGCSMNNPPNTPAATVPQSIPVPDQQKLVDDGSAKNIADKLGFVLGPMEIVDKTLLPANRDIPYIYQYWLSQKTAPQGGSILMILRLGDDGNNFNYLSGFKVSDKQNDMGFQVNREGPGLYSCVITVYPDAGKGEHIVSINLTDTKNNFSTQDFRFQIVENTGLVVVDRITVSIPSAAEETGRIWSYLERIDFYDKYGYKPVFPSSPEISSLIDKARAKKLSPDDAVLLANIFEDKIYNKDNYATAYRKVVAYLPVIEKIFPTFDKYNQKWGFKIFPKYTILLTLYGMGGSYNNQIGRVILQTASDGQVPATSTIIHEMVHIGIEECIVQKYSLDQRIKERIVDLFLRDNFSAIIPGYALQSIGDSSIDPYLKSEGSWDNLPSRVEAFVTKKPIP